MTAELRTVTWQLNRLAHTLTEGVTGDATLPAHRAALVWMNAPDTDDMLGALNRGLGITDPKDFVGFREVCNLHAETVDDDPVVALSKIPA